MILSFPGRVAFLFATTALSGAAAAQSIAPAAPATPETVSAPSAVADPLRAAFLAPPDTARPRVWWHWLSGNVSQDGITKDFEWMKRAGIAGAMMFDGDMGAPNIVPERVTVLSPQWYANLRFAASEADRLGLEFAMAAGPGWSETGGPWVKPEWGMKKFVWSETRIVGGRRAGKLAPLPANAGPFQTVAKRDATGKLEADRPGLARDVAVLAFRTPSSDMPLASLAPRITTNAPGVDTAKLVDGDVEGKVVLPAPAAGAPVWVRYDFANPATIRALTYVGPLGGRFADGPQGRVEASDDGTVWRSIRTLVGAAHNPAPERTFALPATTALHFRVVFDRAEVSRNPWPQEPGIAIAELALVPGARVDLFEDRAGFGVSADADALRTPNVAPSAAIRSADIVDLTDRLRADGTLDWTAPAGDWTVLRAGWSLTGEVNHPATPEGTGLEVDKLNAAHVRAHLDAYLTPVINKLGPLVGERGLRYLLTDSWEAGQENWTEPMPAEFRQRRGYDLTRMLPVLAGHVVDSAEKSDAFLWDFRRTLADLVAENHYGTITRFAKEHGLGYYGEATGAAWPTVADGMLAKSQTDIPMGEFWAIPFGGKPAAYQGVVNDEFPADIIETRSTAHVYGKPLVAAEALTSSLPQWTSTPWSLKWVADKYMAMGVNRLVIHTSPHQPDDTHKPGLTLGPFGQVFTRHETWAEMAKPWIDYLARSSYLLQQGVPAADVLYFYGEGAPSGVPYRDAGGVVDLPGHGFDYVNADALLRLATVENGRITFPGGARYRLLILPEKEDRLTLPIITKLRDMVAEGAILVGPKPTGSPSLGSSNDAVRTIADSLWGQTDGGALTVNSYGKGRVYWRRAVSAILAAESIVRDFDYAAPDPAMDLRFTHRTLPDGELYFITNQSDLSATVPAWFRSTGRVPELWHAETGTVEKVGYTIAAGRTQIPLTLTPYEAVFVIFRKPAATPELTLAAPSVRKVATLAGDWTLRLPGGAATKAAIGSWTANPDPSVRYFSGVGTYQRVVNAPANWFGSGERLFIDLGAIGDVAEVRVNGVLAGTAWAKPYRVDVSDQLHRGANTIEIRVANTWQNRFVGDLQPGATPHAWTNVASGGGFALLGKGLSATTPLTPSGLLEPVRIVAEKQGEPQ
ncbi:glycoside hydrolase [Sphingomonas populi]|uniref:Glycoside hydrolase n=1 Tax=Sphingomonas populi TaxID=2484750 RepID=A0A4Q6XRT1_9SPHN|nr:glycosyl hydrolase [Sphingomonas populi]RZF59217.1 glycoside hydrolase [Sphingomonas populi]